MYSACVFATLMVNFSLKLWNTLAYWGTELLTGRGVSNIWNSSSLMFQIFCDQPMKTNKNIENENFLFFFEEMNKRPTL